MKKTPFHFAAILLIGLTTLFFTACNDSKKKDNKADEEEVEPTSSYSFPEADNPPAIDEILERKDYTFTTEVITDEEGTAEKIIVSMKNNVVGATFVKEITPEPLNPDEWRGFGDITEKDMNFDGYPDLQVCRGPINYLGNFTFAAWLWDQELHDFVEVPDFEDLYDPEYKPEDKTVTSCLRMEDHEENAVYKWNGNKLELISSENFDYDELNDE